MNKNTFIPTDITPSLEKAFEEINLTHSTLHSLIILTFFIYVKFHLEKTQDFQKKSEKNDLPKFLTLKKIHMVINKTSFSKELKDFLFTSASSTNTLESVLMIIDQIPLNTLTPTQVEKYFFDRYLNFIKIQLNQTYNLSNKGFSIPINTNKLIQFLLEKQSFNSLYIVNMNYGDLSATLPHSNIDLPQNYSCTINCSSKENAFLSTILIQLRKQLTVKYTYQNVLQYSTMKNQKAPPLIQHDAIIYHMGSHTNHSWNPLIAEQDTLNRFSLGSPPKQHADYAYISHLLACLNTQGLLCSITTQGILFRGQKELHIRKNMISKNLIDQVFIYKELEDKINQTKVLIAFKKNKKCHSVYFADLRNCLNEKNHSQDILQSIAEKKTIEGKAILVDREQIELNNFDLRPTSYLSSNKSTTANQHLDQSIENDYDLLLKKYHSVQNKINQLIKKHT